MSVILAATWNPRGEEDRFRNLISLLCELYSGMVIVLTPQADPHIDAELEQWLAQTNQAKKVLITRSPEWSSGRFLALKLSLDLPGDYVHYVDFDRLLRWVETRPDELRQTVKSIRDYDCLIIGRDAPAYATHPQALVQTEAISNLVSSYFLSMSADVSAGSKGFSRGAVEFLMANTQPGQPFATDAEWTILLHRAGFRVGTIFVSGLDWESADRYRAQAASLEQQQEAARIYDADPAHWAARSDIALEIVQTAIEAAKRTILHPNPVLFDFDSVFEVNDYMYFYQDMLTPESTDLQVEFLIRELELNQDMSILDLACGFGRHANRLAKRGYRVTGIDITPGFLELAGLEAEELGAKVEFLISDMRQIDYDCQFDRVLLLFTAFGYFTDEENLLVLQNIAHALKPGGRLVFDIHNRDTFFKGFMPYIVTEKEGNLMIDRHKFDTQTGRLYNQRIVIRDGVRRDKPFFVRMYNPTEIQMVLSQAGLTIISLFGGWDGSLLTSDSRRMIIIAEKVNSLRSEIKND